MKLYKWPYLSLILPVYNETDRLASGFATALAYLKKQRYSWEIIIADDGSVPPVDPKKYPVTILRLPTNTGKGAAIREGVAKARGSVIVFSDIDFSVAIVTMKRMLGLLQTYPIVISSRRASKSQIDVHQSVMRESAGRVFTLLSNLVCRVGVTDATCGFKGYQAPVAKKLFMRSRINRWVFDTELLFLARKYGFPVSELPVVWKNNKGSKVRMGDYLTSAIDLLRIRWYDITGKYS